MMSTVLWCIFWVIVAFLVGWGLHWYFNLVIDSAEKWEPEDCERSDSLPIFATGDILGSTKPADSEIAARILQSGEFVVPHHGPGLSEAEDALRETF